MPRYHSYDDENRAIDEYNRLYHGLRDSLPPGEIRSLLVRMMTTMRDAGCSPDEMLAEIHFQKAQVERYPEVRTLRGAGGRGGGYGGDFDDMSEDPRGGRPSGGRSGAPPSRHGGRHHAPSPRGDPMGPPRLLDEFADHAPRNDRRGGDPRGSGARGGRDAAFSDDESLGGEGLDSESDFGGRGGGRSGGRSGGDPYGGGLSGGRSGGDPYGGVRSGGRSGGGDPYGGGRSGGHRRH